MPLETGKSRAAFEHNLKTELAAGKPKEQALAIAYAKQRGDCEKLDAILSICDSWADAYAEKTAHKPHSGDTLPLG